MKIIKTIGVVIGAVALVATGIGVAMGGLAAAASATATTFMTVGAIAGVASGVIGLGVSLFASRPSFGGQGNPLSFQTNPQSGLPYAIGRTRMSGLKIDGRTSSSKTDGTQNLLWLAALMSCTPAHAIDQFKADNEVVTFDGSGAATSGNYAGFMAQKWALGAMPQTSAIALTVDGFGFPGHGANTKLSGMVHAEWCLRYDPDGKHYAAGLTDPAWIGRWRKCYDPRKDSTYPGGSGAHRAGNEATYEWTRNGPINALNWAMGHYANGKLVCGIGAPMETIRVSDFVAAANVADANGWGCGGVEYTTDSKWDIFKRMLAAGGAVPTKAGAMIGCRVKTPRVSLGTIEEEDFLDELTYVATKPRRERFNTVLPRYVSEAHDWQVITGSEVSVPALVTADSGKRTKGIDFPLVQAEVGQAGYDGDKQAGQLAAYEIVDSREASIECTVKPRWIGLRVGDCVVLNKPSDGIVNQKVILTGVTLDPARGVLKLSAETETDSKHAFALGQTTTPPPAPTLSVPAGRPDVPGPAAWGVAAISMADGQPGIRISGSIDDPIADRVMVQYRPNGTANWIVAPDIVGTGTRRLDIGPLDSLTGWDVRLAYAAGQQVGDWLEILNTATGPSAIARLNPRGSYDAATTYYPGDVVVWDSGTGATGDSYRRIDIGPTTGTAPSDGTKWVLLAIRGAPGTSGNTWVSYAYSADGTVGFTLGIPEDRGFQGLAVNRESPVESTDPADYIWIPYRGPANFGLVPHANVAVGPDYIVKTGAGSSWDASAYSSEAYVGGAFASFSAGAFGAEYIFGLNTDPSTDADWSSLDFGIVVRAGGDIEVFESGVGTGVLTTYADGDVFTLTYDGRQVRYFKNGVSFRYRDAPADLRLYLDSSIALGRIAGIKFGPAGAAGADGYSVSPASSALNVISSFAGVPESSEFPKTVTFSVFKGATDLSTDGAITYSLATVDCSASLGGTNNRVLTVNNMSADSAVAIVTIFVSGVLISIVYVVLSKTRAGLPSIANKTTTISAPTSTSYTTTPSAGVIGMLGINSGDLVRAEADLHYGASSGTTRIWAKAQYRYMTGPTTWSAWTDIDVEDMGSTGDSAVKGVLRLSKVFTAPANSLAYQFQLLARHNGTSVSTIDGTFAVSVTV